MKNLRVVDQAGNQQDYETEFVPKIGERIELEYGFGSDPVRTHYFRVKDVTYRLDNGPEHQAGILIEEESDPELWPVNHKGVFISHITEEKPVALVLQKYLKLAFGDTFRVFVSSDSKSIGGGTKWYTHTIEHLRLSEVVLVLVSQESKGREWINFDAGSGEGSKSLVIPVGIKNISLGQLSYPLAGIQGRTIDDIGSILTDIGKRLDAPVANIDAKAYLTELHDAEEQLVYKSLKVEPVVPAFSNGL